MLAAYRELRFYGGTGDDARIEEEPGEEEVSASSGSSGKQHIDFPDVNEGLDEIEQAFDSRRGRPVSRQHLDFVKPQGKKCRKMDKRFRILDPLAHFRGNKKKQCEKGPCK